MRFWKYQGAGNDFVLFEAEDVPPRAAELARRVCHRRFGVGADGVLFVLPHEEAAGRMRIFNADGSEAEMCGNGLRCVALHLWAERGAGTEVTVATQVGLLGCRVAEGASPRRARVRIQLGRPGLARRLVCGTGEDPCVEEEVSVAGGVVRLTAVSMGNPHVVLFRDDLDGDRLLEEAQRLGPVLESHPLFPERANVSFVRRTGPGRFQAFVWERGCGLTAACGTGAGAIAVAARLTGRSESGSVAVELPGGTLTLDVGPDFGQVWLEGPAELSFMGEVEPWELSEPRWLPGL